MLRVPARRSARPRSGTASTNGAWRSRPAARAAGSGLRGALLICCCCHLAAARRYDARLHDANIEALEPGRAGGASSLAQGGRGPRLLLEAMTEMFPRLWETHYDRQVGCDPLGKQKEHMYPIKQQVSNTTSGLKMKLLWPGCFASVRRKLDLAVGFGRSIREFRPVRGPGRGEHFQSADGRFYMQEASAQAMRLLQGGPGFIKSYMQHMEDNPSTFLPQLVLAVTFEWANKDPYQPNFSLGLLITENFRRGFSVGEDSFLEFDLRGSSGEHGRRARCSPVFPLGFWRRADDEDPDSDEVVEEGPDLEGEDRAAQSPARHVEGEDLDFYALRTQVGQAWIERNEELLKTTSQHLDPFMHRMFKDYVENTPMSQSCLGGTAGKQWLEGRGGFNLCKELALSIKGLKQARDNISVWREDDGSVQRLKEVWRRVEGSACPLYRKPAGHLEGRPVDLGHWKEFIKEEMVAFDSVREFFGYPASRDGNLTRKPLVVEPCMRDALVDQLKKDLRFLTVHDVTGYSMRLLIKHDPTAPDGMCNVHEDVKQLHDHSHSQGRSIFERHKWGIRAKNASAGEAAELAVFKFKFVDFLAERGNSVSTWSSGDIDWLFTEEAQAPEPDHGASIRLPQVWKMLLDNPVMHAMPKCKNLAKHQAGSQVGQLCWTGCGEAAVDSCKKLSLPATRFFKLAEYDFAGDWSKGHKLGCHGMSNFGTHIRRSLCGLTSAQPSPEDIEQLGNSFRLEAVPEPFRSDIDGQEIERIFRAQRLVGRKSDLHKHLHFLVPNSKVPMVLKRLAVMAYFDFAQRPLPWDLLPAEKYANRLSRFLSAWVSSPSDLEWEGNMCPNLKGAGCVHIGGDVWEPDDPEIEDDDYGDDADADGNEDGGADEDEPASGPPLADADGDEDGGADEAGRRVRPSGGEGDDVGHA